MSQKFQVYNHVFTKEQNKINKIQEVATYDPCSFFGFGQPPTVGAQSFEPIAIDIVSPPSKLAILL